MGGLIVGQKGRQIRRCAGVCIGVSNSIGRVVRFRIIGGTAVAVLHARRQPSGGVVARGLVEGDAGAVFLDVEGDLKRRRQHRLLVVGMVAGPAFAEDFPADCEAVRLLHAAPVIGGGRAPVIFKPDAEAAAGGFNHRIGAVLDGELRFERGGDAPGEEPLFFSGRQSGQRGKAFRGRELEPVELQHLAFRGEPTVGAGAGEIVQRAARLTFSGAQIEGP
jgi:hypothetical protein